MNPATIRVYYHEDLDRTEDEIESELTEDIGSLDVVESVTVEQAWASSEQSPAEAELSVLFNEAETDSGALTFKLSIVDYVHNAQTKK